METTMDGRQAEESQEGAEKRRLTAMSGRPNLGAAARMSARAVLAQEIEQLTHRADGLKQLLAALPMELPEWADMALCDLIYRSRR
jgi:hypothetical protein